MKKKLLLTVLVVAMIFINACSCHKFNIDTYNRAVQSLNSSTGFDYDLTIISRTEGENFYTLQEISDKYRLTPTGTVENFSSTLNEYKVSTSDYNGDGDPQLTFVLNRYYMKDEGKFYTNEYAVNSIEKKFYQDISYEDKYTSDSKYHLKNLIPTFSANNISDFEIEEDKSRSGYSIATFNSSCPSSVQCESEVVSYKVTIDRNFYFSKIEFSIKNEAQTISYKYEFNKFNRDVDISFPQDLINYTRQD